MGPNEPNLQSQADLTPQQAADLWMKNIEPLRQEGYSTFITPAVASSITAIQWYQEFFKACTGCQFDIMALHYYSTQSADMIAYITSLYQAFKMPIWVTEYACMDYAGGPQASNPEQVTEFMRNVTTWMENTDYVKKFFPYGIGTADEININRLDALMGSDGKPNALGCLSLGGC
jgi:O-glycosyl hydrolase